MSGFTTTATASCAPSAAWSPTRPAGASGFVAVNLPLAASSTDQAKQAHKRFTMAGTDIYGWPLGPRDWTSG